MIQLQIAIQILGIIALLLLIAVLGYLLYLLGKMSKSIDSLIEIVSYYDKLKAVVTDFMEGPGKMYLSALQMIISFAGPLLTKRRKNK